MSRIALTPLPRNRDFLLLQWGQLFSTAGTSPTPIAYPLLVLALTHSPAQAGIVGFAGLLPYGLFVLFAGVAADRWNRRRVMLVADYVRVAAIGWFSLLAIRVSSVARGIALAAQPLGPLAAGLLLAAIMALLALWATLSPSTRRAPSLRDLAPA